MGSSGSTAMQGWRTNMEDSHIHQVRGNLSDVIKKSLYNRAIWVICKRLDYLLYLMVTRGRSMRIKWQKNFRVFWRARNLFQPSTMVMTMILNRSRQLFENHS